MKCNHCGSEWNAGRRVSVSLTACPFCGRSLTPETPPASFESSAEVLRHIALTHGPDVLLGKRLKAFFLDYAKHIPDNRCRLVYTVADLGAAQILADSLPAGREEQKAAVERAVSRLTEAYVAKDAAEAVIREFAAALGWETETAKPEPIQYTRPADDAQVYDAPAEDFPIETIPVMDLPEEDSEPLEIPVFLRRPARRTR